ncbi:MAG: aminopeptidase, partial [Candidatus Latescibacteria bacterium]|nr:aminopeptidase [Candidatus Latescibacterota bacterium]
FNEFMAGTVAALDSLYALSLPREEVLQQRSTVFSQRQHLFATIEFSSNRYAGFTSWEINNARLLSYRRYHTELESFQRVLTGFNDDLRSAIRAFARCAAAVDPWQCLHSIADARAGVAL